MWNFIFLWFFFFNINLIVTEKKNSKYVTTLIDAKWKDTPLVLEIAEYLNDECPNKFWKFVDEVCKRSSDFEKLAKPRDHYNLAVSIVKNILSPAEMAVMNLGLSLRYYSPKIEMFSQMADNKMTNLNCNNFIDIGGNIVCDLKELQIFLDQSNYTPSATYTIDHFYLGKKNSNKTLILYGQIGTNGFSELHNNLKILTESNQINYVLRHYIKNRSDKKLRLSGYGVELQMKSTEYKATDDLDVKDAEEQLEDNTIEENDELDGIYFSVLKNSYPSKLQQLENLQKFLLDNNNEIGSFKVWQYQELSHQAAERIMSSSPNEAIHVLTDISQNFPIMAKSLIKIKVNNDLKNEMKSNQDLFTANLNIQPSETALFVNGLYFDFDVIDILTLLDSVRSELRVMEALHEMGFDRKEMNKILALDLSNNVNTQDFAIDIRDSAINWINDIEHDSQYKGWSYSLTKLFHPTFPGMLRNIRRNLYNLVIILDPTSKKSVPLITWAKSLYTQTAPLRIGFVFLTNFDMDITGFLDASVAANNGYHYFMEKKSPNDAIDFLFSLLSHATDDDITVDDVKNTIIFKDVKANISDILGENSEYDIGRHLANDFIKKIGFKKFPQVLLNGVPLPSNQLNTDAFEEAVLSMIMSQTPFIQKAFYRGEVTDKDDIVDFLMNQTNVMPRINERILKTDTNQWLNLLGSISHDSDFKKWSSEETTLWLMKNVHYIHLSRKITTNHLFTLWLVLDLELQSGRTALKEALEYLKLNSDTRLTIIIHRGSSNMSEMNINRIVLAAMSVLPAKESYQYVRRLIDDSTFQTILNGKFKIENEVIKDALKRQNFLLDVQHYYCTHVLGFKANEKVVIFNGRIIGPLDDDEEFTSEDFVLLERFSYATYGNKLFKYLDENNFFKEKENTADIIMKITSLLVQKPHSRSRFDVPYYDDKYSVVNIPARNSNAVAFNIISIVDPVSRGAQKLGPILDIIQNTVNCDIKIFLNSVEKNSDIPLKSFYRFVLNSELQFTNEGEILGASAKFTKLPTSSLLTQNIHVPENWLVEVVNSIYDLDNIRLDNVAIGVHSEYELEYLLLEGHCFETLTGSPPRGLQITLGTEKQPMMVDTIVMANLGYFQLKAYPGEWLLRLRQGRSAEIYDISSIEGSDVLQKENSIKVLISSLKSNVLKLKVTKKPDKINNDLLGEDDEEIGIWNSISRTFSNSDDGDEQEEKLNIFSLASGHLYERFLKIMMLSVIKHTKTPVKFWFLKNYLSPTLKNFLPHMAKEYGFEYELVQYKWPRWLHQQTEKQRTIWGYKILFLDVLFPLDVKKIIFVDADQVVRADLKELASMDLGGAPYAYTPFCDSRKEMDGFRFWKQGYWKNHLQGRSYHISALYVVNLKRFRRIAAGDRLRGQYQALSQDPNSLSNLDQDLPNNMIHQVAIKTLPQEWLWCETWCDDKSKKNAKTIDLCNNPMTKEAKLQAAMRIIPEWTSYDEELKRLQMKIDNESRLIENEEHDIQIPTIHEEL